MACSSAFASTTGADGAHPQAATASIPVRYTARIDHPPCVGIIKGRAKGVELIPETGTIAPRSAVRTAETPRHACAKVCFGRGAGDVHAAAEQTVDQRADDLRAVQHFAALAPDADAET